MTVFEVMCAVGTIIVEADSDKEAVLKAEKAFISRIESHSAKIMLFEINGEEKVKDVEHVG